VVAPRRGVDEIGHDLPLEVAGWPGGRTADAEVSRNYARPMAGPAVSAPSSGTPSSQAPSSYPDRWEGDVALADGGVVQVRPVRPDDADRVRAFHARQSRESIYFRYFSPMPKLSQRELERLTEVDYVTRMAFVALMGDDVVGMASYDLWREHRRAEVAFIVDDEQQGRGIATVLLEYLIVAARENGLEGLTAQVLPTNRRMLSVFHRAGFQLSSSFDEGVVEVELGIQPTEESRALIEQRERLAEARSVGRLLFPETVAVIGAGRERGGVGHEVFRRLVEGDFGGPVFPVNPEGASVASVRAYPSVLDIPDEVDLAVIAVPAPFVVDVVDECARKRVRGLAIISAGLEHLTVDGRPADEVIRHKALRWGMRIIGPESMGAVNTAPGTRLHATFTTVGVEPGRVGFLTQSGTLGVAALEHARRVGVGISTFVDIGRRIDVSGNDLLQFWAEDERTDLALLYLETFGNPRKFTRIARRMARDKPIVAVKSGRGGPPEGGDQVDGALASVWPADATVDALLAQSGVIRVDTPPELFELARVLVHQPVPRGRRVAIVGNARGAAVLAADAVVGADLEVVLPGERTMAGLAPHLPSGASVGTTLDLTWEAGPDHYGRALRAVLDDDGVDAVIVIYAPPIDARADDVARALGAAADDRPADGHGKPIVATFLGSESGTLPGSPPIPLFEFPGQAASVLGKLARYGEWCRRPVGEVPEPDGLDPAAVAAVAAIAEELLDGRDDGVWLDRDQAARLLTAAGLPVARHRMVASLDEARAAAQEMGFPVVLKATGVDRYHRGEGGGVALDLHDDVALEGAYRRMVASLGPAMGLAVVQQLAAPGVDLLLAAHQDPSYGAVVSVGIGGVMAAANPDLPIRILPLTDTDARDLVASSPVAGLLANEGADGGATRACEDLLLRIGFVVDHVPEIADLLLNPVIIGPEGAMLVDAWVRLAPYTWGPPAVRRL
jgi:acyl-CoA synthetase (NDP forming)/RimJ/RimL family protein N-acetyltransferase